MINTAAGLHFMSTHFPLGIQVSGSESDFHGLLSKWTFNNLFAKILAGAPPRLSVKGRRNCATLKKESFSKPILSFVDERLMVDDVCRAFWSACEVRVSVDMHVLLHLFSAIK